MLHLPQKPLQVPSSNLISKRLQLSLDLALPPEAEHLLGLFNQLSLASIFLAVA